MTILTLGDARLAYWEAGSGPALVFIHGVGTSGDVWAEDLAELAADFRLIVYNRRGYGASSPSPRSWDAHARDAVGVVEALGAAPAVVVGYSGGAMIALDLALRRPDLAAAVILLDPAFNLRRCLTGGLLATLATVRLLRRLKGDRAAAAHWLRYVSSYSTGGSAFERKVSAERRERLLTNAAGIFDDMGSGGGTADERRLAEIRVPLTLVEASLSPSFLRRSCARLGRLLPRARRVTLERSGHWVGVDARAELLRILRESAPACDAGAREAPAGTDPAGAS